ncbi:unnamed protein product [Toxocara canis]|uniref:FAT domain-containing protein n=1 Tax=Toxocara canis TaxID=6265 RepID=A0A183U2V7_TOXCA|nr:unnamed protein product [Toxocara canis]
MIYLLNEPSLQIQLVVGEGITAAELLPSFGTLLRDLEAEVRIAAASNVQKFCAALPIVDREEAIQKYILPAVKELASDQNPHVRKALSSVVMGLAPILGNEQSTQHLLPIYLTLLKDETAEVRLRIISSFDKVLHAFQRFSMLFCHSLMKIGTTRIPYGHKPLMLCKGIVHCQTQSGRTGTVLLESHKTDMVLEGKSPAALQKLLDQALVLKRWLNAWRICDFTKNKEHWRKYAFAAMQNADVELGELIVDSNFFGKLKQAIRVLKQTDEVAMVWALEEVQFIEERNLLAGHLSLIMEQFDIAETHFLRSSRPKEALDMRRDLMHWDKALQLANRLAPEEIPYISKEYAQQLEFM